MQIVNLNMVTYGLAPIVHASRYDVGREFRFDLYNADVEYVIPPETWVIIHGRKPSKHTFAYSNRDTKDPTIVRFEGSSIYLKTTQEMTASTGNTKCEFILRQPDGTIFGSLNWILKVEEGALPNDVIATMSELISYQRMMQSMTHSYTSLKYELDKVDYMCEKVPILKKDIDDRIWEVKKLYGPLQKKIDAWNATINHISRMKLEQWKWKGDEVSYDFSEYEVQIFSYDLGDDFKNRLLFVIPDILNMPIELVEHLSDRDTFLIFGSYGQKVYCTSERKPDFDLPVIVGYLESTGHGMGSINGYSKLWDVTDGDPMNDWMVCDCDDCVEGDELDAGDLSGDDRHGCCDV